MTIKLLTEHHLEFLSLKGDCTGSYESTLVKIPHCWKSCVTAQCDLCDMVEDASHYFFQCRKYTVERQVFTDTVSGFKPLNINVILYGNKIGIVKLIWSCT